MKISLAQNIRALRKERRMTQEMLAEALGVTVGAVHKWETGASMPEIRLLIELAELFCVSLDALLGYEMRSSSAESVIERIKECLCAKDFEAVLSEAEKALLRYPNTFRVVHCCADVCERMGVETRSKDALLRAVELMERSITLLSQNDDPQISEVTIRSDIAICHIMLGQTEKGIEILKKYNAGGINNSLLGLICSQQEKCEKEETAKYLQGGMCDVVTNAIRCMSGYVNYYMQCENVRAALESAEWLAATLRSLKTDSSAVCYLDKIIATFQAVSAAMQMLLGNGEEAQIILRQAYVKANAFDADPVYDLRGIKFYIDNTEKITTSDDLGESAAAAIEKLFASEARFRPVQEMWEQIKAENKEENYDE